MSRVILSALFSHWWRNPLQLFTLLAGLALGTALWSGVQAINAEARASYDAAAATLGGGQYAQITARDGPIPQDVYVALRRAGWNVSPVVEGRLGSVRLVGIDPLTAPAGIGPLSLGETADLGAFIGTGQVFGTAETLSRLGDVGVPGVAAADMAPNTAITDIGVAQRLLGRVGQNGAGQNGAGQNGAGQNGAGQIGAGQIGAGQIDRLLVGAVQPLRRGPLPDGLVQTAPQQGNDVARLTDSFHLNLTAFGLLSFAVGLFIVHGAIGLAFEQRRGMVRTLRALGAPLGRLIGLMGVELMVLGLVAGALGVALGYGIAAALLPDVAATLRGLYGADVAGTLALRPAWWLSGMGIALGGTGVAASGALWSLARMPLLAGAQTRAQGMARAGWGLAAASAVLLAVAGALAVWGSGLLAGFAMLGALLIGGALALPGLLGLALRLAGARARGPVAQWFWADSQAQLPGLSLALMALLLAMAANVGVSTMVSSFRLTFIGFLDQRLASELYVSAMDVAQASVITRVAEAQGAVVLPILSVDRQVAGYPAEVYGARDHATYRDNWRFLTSQPGAWDSLARGEGVLVNEQLFRRAGLGLGSVVDVAPGVRLPVLGVYGDYGNPVGQVVVNDAVFAAAYPQVVALRFGLRVAPGAVAALRTALQDAGVPGNALVDQAAIKALSLSVFERTFTVTAALNVLTLAVAGFAILMSLLTLAAMRLPQLAPVWALGLTRRRLAALDLLRAVVLAALTGALALPLGLALAWALLAVVNVEAFGWRLPMYLFPLDYLRLGGFAILAAGAAALWPARALARMQPVRLLGVFRHER